MARATAQLPVVEATGCCAPGLVETLSREQATDMAALFKALGDPARLQLLALIKSSAGEVQVMKDGFGTDFSEELAKAVLTEHDITVIVDFHSGDGKAVAYGCDLTYEYVKINGDYRT